MRRGFTLDLDFAYPHCYEVEELPNCRERGIGYTTALHSGAEDQSGARWFVVKDLPPRQQILDRHLVISRLRHFLRLLARLTPTVHV
jgi:hypothetical protein